MLPPTRPSRSAATRCAAGAALLAAFALAACVINPATGRRQISLVPENREIAIGRDADRELVASMGLYPDQALQEYVAAIGRRLAAASERPDLPWTFRVVDNPVVNAFALPGGYVYITRGILAHFNSEAELAAVLGHEIGHVTARHSVNQMSKAQLAGLGIGLGTIVEPGLRRYGDLTGMGLGLLFLKYGRDDERQADDLGLRYISRADYAPSAMIDVFDMLGRVSSAAAGNSLPGWMSTHPAPENREARTRENIADAGLDPESGSLGTAAYLQRIDGLVFGKNPRQGFFRDGWFSHPDLRFRMRFPGGWDTSNRSGEVSATSQQQDASVQLTLATESTAAAAAARFLAGEGITRGAAWDPGITGLRATGSAFRMRSGETDISGLAAFVEHGGRVFRLIGAATAAADATRRDSLVAAMASFSPLTDPELLAVETDRLEIISLPGAMTLASYQRQSPSSVDLETLALVNGVAADTRLPAGRRLKRVQGGGT